MGSHDQTERKQAWIRLRGAPDDPESWDLGAWNGIVWEVRRDLPNGRRVILQIRDYMILEQFPSEITPAALYRDETEGD